MIVNNLLTFVRCKSVSVADFLTSSFIHLNDGPAWPVGFNVPVLGGDKLTVLFYTRLISHDYEKARVYIDGSDGVLGGLDSFSQQGIFAGNYGFRVNGKFFGSADMTNQFGVRYIYDPYFTPGNSYAQIVLRTTNSTSQRAPGSLSFNIYAGSNSPNDGLPAVDYAYLAIYYRELSDAEINMLTPPTNYTQLYNFSNFISGDTTILDVTGSGLNGTYVY